MRLVELFVPSSTGAFYPPKKPKEAVEDSEGVRGARDDKVAPGERPAVRSR